MQDIKNKVLVLMATYNGAAYIKDQINSIANQDGVIVNLAIFDDQSTDNTLEIAKEKFSTCISISTHKNSTKTGSAGQNFFKILKETRLENYEYIAFSDQDDIWNKDKLKIAIKNINENELECYSSNVTSFWDDGREMLIVKSQPQTEWDHLFEAAGPGCTYVMTSKFALQIQKYLNTNNPIQYKIKLHDWAIYAWARSRNAKWLIDKTPTMRYRQHTNNVIGVNAGIHAASARIKEIRNGNFRKSILDNANFAELTELEPIKKIAHLSISNRLWLLMNSWRMRRRFRDKVALGFLFLIMK